jgi:hypothetical protein
VVDRVAMELQWQWRFSAHRHPLSTPVHLYRPCLVWQGLSSAIKAAVLGPVLGNTDSNLHGTTCRLMVRIESSILYSLRMQLSLPALPGPWSIVLILPWDHHCLLAQRYGARDVLSWIAPKLDTCPPRPLRWAPL